MAYRELGRQVAETRAQCTPACIEDAVGVLLRQGEDTGGGVNAIRLVRHLLGGPRLRDAQASWAYEQLKPAFRAAFEQIPSLIYSEGD